MKKIIASALLTVFLASPGLAIAQQSKGPRIEVIELRYDAGDIIQGTIVTHVFEVRNTGTETLVIDRINSG